MRWDELQVGQLIRFRAFPDVLRVVRAEGGRVWLEPVNGPLTGSVAAWLDGRHESDGLAMPPDHEVEAFPLVEVDYAKLELRVVAQMSLQPGEDIHQKTADALGCSRAEAKTANFKALYGKGTRDEP